MLDLDSIPRKQLNELEHNVRELLVSMRKAKLQAEPLMEHLRLMEKELGEARRARFDEVNSEYHTY